MQANESATKSARSGWSSVLSRATAAMLFFELITGLAITFGPFHPAIQWGLLFHTIVGIASVAPVCWYFLRHWRAYRTQAMSDVLLLGYAGAVVLGICILSGVVLTGQAVAQTG